MTLIPSDAAITPRGIWARVTPRATAGRCRIHARRALRPAAHGVPRSGPAARALRYGLADWHARTDADRPAGRTPPRPRHVRHESGHLDRHARHARAARDHAAPADPRRDVLDDRRRGREPDRPAAARSGSAQEQGGLRARTVTPRRRRQDQPQGRRRIHASTSAASRRTRGSTRAKASARCTSSRTW